MLIDVSAFANGQDQQADICIIGAGPAGIILADRLNKSGLKVLVCEAGGMAFTTESQNSYQGETDGPVPFEIKNTHHPYTGPA